MKLINFDELDFESMHDGIVSGLILGGSKIDKENGFFRIKTSQANHHLFNFKLALLVKLNYDSADSEMYKKPCELRDNENYYAFFDDPNILKYGYYFEKRLIEMLNPMGMLIWWLSRGHLTVHFNKKANCKIRKGKLLLFNYKIEKLLYVETRAAVMMETLKEKFDINGKIYIKEVSNKHGQCWIKLNVSNLRKLIDIIFPVIPYIPKKYLVKVNLQYRGRNLKESKFLIEKYNFSESDLSDSRPSI